MIGMKEYILVVDHEEEKYFISEGAFADQYYDEMRKTDKYEFLSGKEMDKFIRELQREYSYEIVEVKSY